MKFKSIAEVILTVFLISVLNIPLNAVQLVAGQTSTTVFLDPPTIKGKVIGETVIVNINVSNVDDLYGWQAGLTFNPDVLNCTGYYEGEFLKRNLTGEEAYTLWLDQTWDNTEGIVYFHGCARVMFPDPFGVSGSGQLAYLTFKVIGTGISDLHLTDVILAGVVLQEWPDYDIFKIPFEVIDVFTVSWGGVDYSVEIISNLTGVDDPPYLPYSCLLDHLFSSEEKTVSFNLTTSYDNFYDVKIPKAILSCDNLSDWTVEVDGQQISFMATENPADTSLYFTYHNSSHQVEITGTVLGKPGDIYEDDVVDIMDILIVGVAFGSQPGDENWEPIADVYPEGVGDEVIDIMDILLIAMHFGAAYP